ncbi:MAG: hypothetical protein CFE44_16735 [Burkholderiales bacterium PBB4]|nr:MAG: hypothetical protein CFE44_16735 [Burkholderiales bacterium PBB4]
MNQQALSSLSWSVADLLRGDFKQSEYGRVMLPFTVLRRLDCVLAPTKAEVLKEYAAKQAAGIAFEPFVKRKAGLDFYNVSSMDMVKLMAAFKPYYETAELSGVTDPDNVLTLKAKLDGQALYVPFEVDRVVNVALKGS